MFRPVSPTRLKRKFDRSISTTGSKSLESSHQQTSFDENGTNNTIDLTSPSPEARRHVTYPTLPGGDSDFYPTLPPVSQGTAPTSSAPVPWSSSPPSHFEPPANVTRAPPPPKEDTARPAKKRVLPSTFGAGPVTEIYPQSLSRFGAAKANAVIKYHQSDGSKSHFADMPDKASVRSREEHDNMYTSKQAAQHAGARKRGAAVIADMMNMASSRQRSTVNAFRAGSGTASSIKSAESATATSKSKSTSTSERIPEPFLSDEQQAVVRAVIEEGKSVFFTGSAGTGKSVLTRAIISQLRHKYRKEPDRIAVTASTGLASCILEGQTLHRWSGIGLGKEPAPELIKKIKRNMKSRQRWMRTKVLIIDEISMVDGQLFDKLEQAARTVRNNGRPFGGIQLVVTGDFFQLPPVPDRNANATFVFDAASWGTCIEHTILLTHVFRQKDERFARMLNEMRLGKMSAETIREFKALSRPLDFHDELEATELYPRREEVENANQSRMKRLSGQLMKYQAVDSGIQDEQQRAALLANYIAPEVLELKKGAQVMLIKNIDEQLVNGSIGIVQSFMDEGTFFAYKDDEPSFLLAQEADDGENDEDKAAARQKIQAARAKNMATGVGATRLWPMVRFNLPDGTSRTMLCTPDEWKTESQQQEIIAKRVQVPLILAWALSIHKAQGQTLHRVKVNLGKVFEKGQAYVALSRATTKEGLQVIGFDERKVMVHPKVLTFYAKLVGHESLIAPKTASVAPPAANTRVSQSTAVARSTASSGVNSRQNEPVDEFDDFGDDFSYEEMLAAEQAAMGGRAR